MSNKLLEYITRPIHSEDFNSYEEYEYEADKQFWITMAVNSCISIFIVCGIMGIIVGIIILMLFVLK